MTVKILLFESPGCSNCMNATKLIKKIIKEYPHIVLKEMNVIEHPKEVVKYGVMSSPTIVINGKVAFIGMPSEKALRKKLEELT